MAEIQQPKPLRDFERTWSQPLLSSDAQIPMNPEAFEPCSNFSLVAPGVYRSSFPQKKNFSFLKKIGIKSILTLILEEYPAQVSDFIKANDMQFFQCGVPGNKEPFVDIPEDKIQHALSIILDKRNHPRTSS